MTLSYSEQEYLEIEQKLNNNRFKASQDKDTPDPGLESKLASKIRKHCKENFYPAIIYPQTKDLAKYIPKGFPDVTIFLKNRVIFLELKSAKGVLKKHQQLMAQALIVLGYEWYLVRSFKKYIELLYGKTRQKPTPEVYVRGVKWTEEI